MRPSEVLARVVDALNDMTLDELTPGAGARAKAGPRLKHVPGRTVEVIPGASRRQPSCTGATNWHELQLEVVTFYPLTDNVIPLAIDDQADMADALETITGGALLSVSVDLGGPGATEQPNTVVYRRTITVVFRKT